ncbi:hypothetical protein [Tsukamurella sp. NPDC003166]|uniref:hypothetical protein n=1 Tax=Tsukamurella sp. NPDC003166 TaxID=3154444 RepID=UPI0033A00832
MRASIVVEAPSKSAASVPATVPDDAAAPTTPATRGIGDQSFESSTDAVRPAACPPE